MNPSRSDKNPQAMYRIRNRRGLAGTGLLLIILILAALWWFHPWEGIFGRQDASRTEAVPRSVAARGSLAEDEQNNIAVFKNVSPSVVHITTLQMARSFLSLDVMQIPRGTGTGFIWDDRGNVITNFHVIQAGQSARVTLADQTSWKAALVGAFPRTGTWRYCVSMPPRRSSSLSW